jgi:hypothetical protein
MTTFLPKPDMIKVIQGPENIREAALKALQDVKE